MQANDHHDNKMFEFTERLHEIQNMNVPGISCVLPSSLHGIIPIDYSHYHATYPGRITVPKCHIRVTWIIPLTAIYASHEQV